MTLGATVEQLTRPPDDNYYEELVERYKSVRRFLPTLLRTVSFESIRYYPGKCARARCCYRAEPVSLSSRYIYPPFEETHHGS